MATIPAALAAITPAGQAVNIPPVVLQVPAAQGALTGRACFIVNI